MKVYIVTSGCYKVARVYWCYLYLEGTDPSWLRSGFAAHNAGDVSDQGSSFEIVDDVVRYHSSEVTTSNAIGRSVVSPEHARKLAIEAYQAHLRENALRAT